VPRLVAEQVQLRHGRADECNARLRARFGEFGALAEKTVTGVHRILLSLAIAMTRGMSR
jgi:hypothetical protein